MTTPVFKSTPTGGKDPLRDIILTATAGSVIFSEGDLGTEMYVIQEGEVDIVKKLGNESHLLSKLERGDFFGEMSVLEGQPRSADAIAATDVKLLAINGSRFDELITKTPEIAVRIIRKYSKRLREANHLLERLAGQRIDPENAIIARSSRPVSISRNRIVDVATGNAFFLNEAGETTIGRADPVTGIQPDVDLTTVDTNRSVSRRHAKIVREEGRYSIVEEVGTVNGTFVNDEKIPTGSPVELKNGDRLRIGLIQMKAVFES